MAATTLWSPDVGPYPPKLEKLSVVRRPKPVFSDKDVRWWAERVAHYIRRSFHIVSAMECAYADLRALGPR